MAALAAPLFSINYVLLDAALRRSLRPIKTLLSPSRRRRLGGAGGARVALGPVDGAGHQLVPAPVAGTRPGTIRMARSAPASQSAPSATQSPADFRQFSLAMFTGLLAYDWLRILIWFDHMGLRVATLVNLSFLGGDRADEAAARFVGHHGRTRAIPDGIRRFGTSQDLAAHSVFHSAWARVGQSLDRGGDARARRRALCRARSRRWPLRTPRRDLAIAAASVAAFVKERAKTGPAGPWLDGAPLELARRPDRFRL